MPALTRLSPIVVSDWVLAASDKHGEWWMCSRVTPYTEFGLHSDPLARIGCRR